MRFCLLCAVSGRTRERDLTAELTPLAVTGAFVAHAPSAASSARERAVAAVYELATYAGREQSPNQSNAGGLIAVASIKGGTPKVLRRDKCTELAAYRRSIRSLSRHGSARRMSYPGRCPKNPDDDITTIKHRSIFCNVLVNENISTAPSKNMPLTQSASVISSSTD